MKNKEFIKKLKKLDLDYLDLDFKIELPVYYGLDDKKNVTLDYESMQEEFNNKLKQIKEILK
jgi:hypothetical protein